MQLLTSPESMRAFDRHAITRHHIPGQVLMENAGRACTDRLEAALGGVSGKHVVVVSGGGNNGGDGLVIARHLLIRGATVTVLLLARGSSLRGDAAANLKILLSLRLRHPKRLTVRELPQTFRTSSVLKPDAIVDAIFGTGFKGVPKGVHKQAMEWINGQRTFVVAVDIPSGIDGGTGEALGVAVRADLTVTMGAAKIGQYLGRGRELCGRVDIVDIGIGYAPLPDAEPPVFRVDSSDVRASLPRRPLTAHKYSVGKVFVLGGSRQYTGAPALAAHAALRAGAGAVVLGAPRSIHSVLSRKLQEVIVEGLEETESGTISPRGREAIESRFAWADVVLLGPGLGRHPETDEFLLELYKACPNPVVIDADALTAIARSPRALRRNAGPAVLTPHTGEMARLMGMEAAEVEKNRLGVASEAARKFRSVVVLKGAPTITASEKGLLFLNSTGNPGMATIGMGDVLAGVIAGLIAQGMPVCDSAWSGAFLHGSAGDLAARKFGQRSLLASDVLACLPEAFREVENS
ncbi:MAG: NAD(P)H-hydrate dehydratase [Bacteroidetes bacterium]|nr:NAD(P)H-hydrate dehydratase [Bacteroidota bacterium]